MKYSVDIDQIKTAIEQIYQSKEWKDAIEVFKASKRIFFIGHGGNLAIADHAAIDCTRLCMGEKVGVAPGSAVLATSLINDKGWDNWFKVWLTFENSISSVPACAIVLTSTGKAADISKAVEYCLEQNIPVICMTGIPIAQFKDAPGYTEVLLRVHTYHDAEMLSLGLTYDFYSAAGYTCPNLVKK